MPPVPPPTTNLPFLHAFPLLVSFSLVSCALYSFLHGFCVEKLCGFMCVTWAALVFLCLARKLDILCACAFVGHGTGTVWPVFFCLPAALPCGTASLGVGQQTNVFFLWGQTTCLPCCLSSPFPISLKKRRKEKERAKRKEGREKFKRRIPGACCLLWLPGISPPHTHLTFAFACTSCLSPLPNSLLSSTYLYSLPSLQREEGRREAGKEDRDRGQDPFLPFPHTPAFFSSYLLLPFHLLHAFLPT